MKRYEETEELLKNDRKSTWKGYTEMGYGVTTVLSGQIYFSENFRIPCIAFFLSSFIQWQLKTSLLALDSYFQKNEKSFKLHSAFNISILSDLSDDEKSSSLPDKSDGENESD